MTGGLRVLVVDRVGDREGTGAAKLNIEKIILMTR